MSATGKKIPGPDVFHGQFQFQTRDPAVYNEVLLGVGGLQALYKPYMLIKQHIKKFNSGAQDCKLSLLKRGRRYVLLPPLFSSVLPEESSGLLVSSRGAFPSVSRHEGASSGAELGCLLGLFSPEEKPFVDELSEAFPYAVS